MNFNNNQNNYNEQGYNQSYNQNYGSNYGAGYGASNGYAGYSEISDSAYNMTIGGVLLYGFIINCLMVQFAFESVFSMFLSNPILFYVIYFVMVIAGSAMVNKSSSPVISFIGYNLIVVPLGMIISLVVNAYVISGYSSVVAAAFGITAVVTLIMMFVSSFAPNFFLSIGRALGITLLVTILVEVIFGLAGFDLGIIDYVVVAIFCGYIGYDWAKANSLPKTYDNAIDSAAMLYVDIVNLFLRIMRILARSQNN